MDLVPRPASEQPYPIATARILSVCRAVALIAAACFCQPAAAQSDEDATTAGDIQMAWAISAAARAAIGEVWRTTGSFPADRRETGMSPRPTDTGFGPVTALDITDGHVFVSFGGEAHPALAGDTVVFSPKVTPDQRIEWVRNPSLETPADDKEGWLRAPIDVVGNSVESWQDFLGPNAELRGPAVCHGEETMESRACYSLADRETEAHFLRSLPSGREFLVLVESSSQALLTGLGVNTLPVGEDRVARFEHCWDAGCDLLEVIENPDGTRSATWAYYVD